jgi:hypothetical protein
MSNITVLRKPSFQKLIDELQTLKMPNAEAVSFIRDGDMFNIYCTESTNATELIGALARMQNFLIKNTDHE